MDNLSGTSIKGYELHEQIGVGGFGAVYRAQQTTVGREVAVKVILPKLANNPDFIRRFETEAQTVARLEHMHIAPLYDYWRDPDGAYLVMRYFRGGSLAGALRGGAYDLQATAHLLDQIAAALTVAHRSNIIHRDLKPGNILLDEDGNAYLADFGIAKDIDRTDSGLTGADAIIGSLDYISPEQARSEPITPCTDLYSLGVMLYEMLTGEHPFPGLSSIERMYKHINDALPPINRQDNGKWDDINSVIQKATKKDPAKRYPDALALATAFREAAHLDRDDQGDNVVEQLTRREQDILTRIIAGLSNKEIAQELYIEVSTVKWYVYQIYRKLGVRSRMQCIVRARELNLVIDSDSDSDLLTITGEGIHTGLLPEPENPYKGLCPFQPADNRDFFGREKLTAVLTARMGESGEFARFLAVVGPSGSGKSSVVRAGLIPALWRGDLPGAEQWFVVDMLPGTYPIDELEIALMRVAADQARNLHEPLTRDQRGLLRAAQLILPDDDSELVVIVDQFEEVFTLVEDEAVCQQFLDLLYTAVTAPRSRVRIVITLRADFYDKPLHYPEFGEMVRSRMETILPLSAEELQRAISNPAEQAGVTFEEGLVASIISEIHYQPGALPLLQYALTELFDNREGLCMTRRAYEYIGQTTGALARRAETIYMELDEAGRESARQMFLRLVTLGEGTEDTRRRVPRAELLAVASDPDLMDEIVDSYTAYRLLALDHDPGTRAPVVEVAHEAILREWKQLRDWLNESRHDIRLQRLLAHTTTDWFNAGQDRSYLLHGTRLQQFEDWAASTRLALTSQERDFLQTSITTQRQQEETERERQARELELAQQAAESARQAEISQRQSANRLRYLVAGLGVFLIAAVLLSIFALDRERRAQGTRAEAEREADVNHSLVLANAAIDVKENLGSSLALALALEAVSIDSPPPEAVHALQTVAFDAGMQSILQTEGNSITDAAFSPDGLLALHGSCGVLEQDRCIQGELVLWNVAESREIYRLAGHASWVRAVHFLPDGESFLSAGDDGVVIRWDTASGDEMRRFELDSGAITHLAISPDGQTAYTSSDQGPVLAWQIATRDVQYRFGDELGTLNSISLSADGKQLAAGYADGTIELWDTANGESLLTVQTSASVEAVAFRQASSAQTTLLTSTADLYLREWDITTGELLNENLVADKLSQIEISPDGRSAVLAFLALTWLWPLDPWSTQFTLVGYENFGSPSATAFSPDGERFLQGHFSGGLRVISMPYSGALRRFSLDVPLFGLAISPDGSTMATGGIQGGTATWWDLNTGQVIRSYDGLTSGVTEIGYSPDGSSVLLGATDWYGTGEVEIVLVDAQTGAEIQRFEGQEYGLRSHAFSPDGTLLFTGSLAWRAWPDNEGRGELIMWDVASGRLIRRFDVDWGVYGIAVSPDGSQVMVSHGGYADHSTLLNVQTGQVIREFPYAPDGIAHIAFKIVWSPEPDTVIVSGSGGLYELNINTGATSRSFAGQTGQGGTMSTIDHTPDWRYLIAGNTNGNLVLWDYSSGQAVRYYAGPPGSMVWEVFFGKDYQTAYSTFYSGIVYEWQIADWSLDELRDWARANRYVRAFSCDEREQYRIEPLCD
ncbi:MAG: protein kinase [Chloroflexi bacterium]|nr:protein kinase [Chloroflexota bacterium]